jgi:spoIIIJ-associated protein
MANIKKDKVIEMEFEGKTVQEAVSKALTTLNVKKSDLAIKVLCEEQKGLFGMAGCKMAKIRVVVGR